jgi:hypothetical protein
MSIGYPGSGGREACTYLDSNRSSVDDTDGSVDSNGSGVDSNGSSVDDTDGSVDDTDGSVDSNGSSVDSNGSSVDSNGSSVEDTDDPLRYFKRHQPSRKRHQPSRKRHQPSREIPTWVEKIFPAIGHGISLISVPKDGNCMFTCIGKAFDVPMQKLRELVAQSILLPVNDSTVVFWREIYRAAWAEKDVTLMHEYSHVADLNHKPLEELLTGKDKYKIHDNIITSTFWGEEFSIRTLESLLTLRLIIINGDTDSVNGAVIHDTPYSINYYIIVYLKNKHYSLVSYNGKTRFKPTELPLVI